MILTNCEEIISQALRFSGETDAVLGSQYVSEYRGNALTYLNRLQMSILSGSSEFNIEMGEPFPWATESDPIRFGLKTKIDINTAFIQNSATITFQTVPTMNLQGRYIRADGDSDFYRISAHTGVATTATIDQGYLKSSITTSSGCYALDYSLGTNILRLVGAMRINAASIPNFFQQAQMSDMNVMLRDYPLTYLETRMPDRFSVRYVSNITNEYIARINSNPNDIARVEIDYVKIPVALEDSDTSFPLCPIINRMILAYGIAYYILVDKNDNTATNYYAQTQAGLLSMVKEAKNQRASSNFDRARLIPRGEQVAGPRNPWAGLWTY